MNRENLIDDLTKLSTLFNNELNEGLVINDLVRKYNYEQSHVYNIIYKRFNGIKRTKQTYENALIIKNYYDNIFNEAKKRLSNSDNEQIAYLLGYFCNVNRVIRKLRKSSEQELEIIFNNVELISDINIRKLNENDISVHMMELFKLGRKHMNNIQPNMYNHFIRGINDSCQCIQMPFDRKSNHTKSVFRIRKTDVLLKVMDSFGFKLTIKPNIIELSGSEKIRQFYSNVIYNNATIFDPFIKEKIENKISKKPFNRHPSRRKKDKPKKPPTVRAIRIRQKIMEQPVDENSFKDYVNSRLTFRLVEPKSKRGIGYASVVINTSNQPSDIVAMLKTYFNVDSKLHSVIKKRKSRNNTKETYAQIFGIKI